MTLAFEDKLCTLLSISSLAVISLSFLTHFDNSHFSVNFSMMSMISNLLPYMLGCCCLVAKLRLPLLWPRGLQSSRFLCSWNFPGENTGVGCYFFPGNLPGVRPASLALKADALLLSHQEGPHTSLLWVNLLDLASFFLTLSVFSPRGSDQVAVPTLLTRVWWHWSAQHLCKLSVANSKRTLWVLWINSARLFLLYVWFLFYYIHLLYQSLFNFLGFVLMLAFLLLN